MALLPNDVEVSYIQKCLTGQLHKGDRARLISTHNLTGQTPRLQCIIGRITMKVLVTWS